MKKFFVSLLMTLCVASGYAQENDCALFGESYTYISFDVVPKDNWPIFFAAVTKADTINVDLSNLDTFTESIFSSCTFVPVHVTISESFQEVYGNAATGSNVEIFQQLYDWQNQFDRDFCNKFEKFKREAILHLQSGENVHIEYFSITGIFCRGGKPKSNFSDGLPDDLLTMGTSVTPVALIDADTTKQELRFIPL